MQGGYDAQLFQTSNEFIIMMKDLQSSNKWVLDDQKPVLAHKMEIGDIMAVRVQTKIGLPIETIGQFFSDPFWMKVMNDDSIKKEILYDNKTIRVIHTITKLPGPISNRQSVLVNTFKREGNTRIITGNRSCNYFPFQKDPSTELTTVYAVGFILDKIDQNTTKLVNFTYADPNGSIPNFIKNSLIGKRSELVANLQGKIKEWAKSKGK